MNRMARAVKGRMGGSKSAPQPGNQGTLGGSAVRAAGGANGRISVLGDEVYLWVLVLLEVGLIAWLRASFSRYHGG